MKKLYVAYNNCPIPTENKGYFGVMNGELVLTTESKSIWIKNELIHKIIYVIIPKKYSQEIISYLISNMLLQY